MQLAQGHHLNANLALVLPAFGCCILLLLICTCAQDGLDTVQLALVVFFLPSTSENTPLALMVVTGRCNLQSTSAFTNVHAYCNLHNVVLVVYTYIETWLSYFRSWFHAIPRYNEY